MATNFKYASISDLTKYFNRVSDFDSKVQIFPSETSGSNHFFEIVDMLHYSLLMVKN